VIKSWKIRFAGHVARRGGMRNPYAVSVNLKVRDHLGEVGVDGRIIFKRLLRKWGVRVWTTFSWLRIGTSGT